MEYLIERSPVFTTLKVTMKAGETFRAEAGAMISMSPSIELQAKSSGKGLLGTLAAAVGGESLFASVYTAKADGELVLAPPTPGDIIRIDLSGQTVFAQSGAYLAGSPGLEMATQGSLKAMASGEGLFLSKISGNGVVFLNSYGAVYEKAVKPGENYIVDCGHIVAFEAGVTYKIKAAAKGLFSTMASGEGLVGEYSGTGKIWIQTRNLSALAHAISPYITKQNG